MDEARPEAVNAPQNAMLVEIDLAGDKLFTDHG